MNTGVAGELERSDCILMSKSGWVTPEHKTPGVNRSRIGLADEPTGTTKRIDTGKQVLGNKRTAKNLKKCDWKSYRSIVPRVGAQEWRKPGRWRTIKP